MRREWLARRPPAREGAHLCGCSSLLGGNLILGRRCFQLLELKLHLVDQSRLALVARAKQVALELLDGQPHIGNQGIRARSFGACLRKLGVPRQQQLLQRLDIVRQRIICAHRANKESQDARLVSLQSHNDSQCRNQPAACGRQVCCGSRQSMPSSKYPSCAGVIVTVRSTSSRGMVEGQTKRPRSSRLANRHMPWPSCQSTLISAPRRPRKTNR